jgi:hypothetical protein
MNMYFRIGVIAFAVFCLGATAYATEKRSKVIDFEDEVVEGLNKRPLDSLSQISDRDRKRHRPHLYRKRVGFKTEVAETIHTLHENP